MDMSGGLPGSSSPGVALFHDPQVGCVEQFRWGRPACPIEGTEPGTVQRCPTSIAGIAAAFAPTIGGDCSRKDAEPAKGELSGYFFLGVLGVFAREFNSADAQIK